MLASQHQRVAVSSGHKCGKSFSAAMLALWWFVTRPRANVILTAPSYKQVNGILWKEVKRLYADLAIPLNGVECRKTVTSGIEREDGSLIWGFTSGTDAQNIAGYSGRLLYIGDESAAISDEVMQVLDTVPNGKVFCISNPVYPTGEFHRYFHEETTWKTASLSSEDAALYNHCIDGEYIYPDLANQSWVDACKQNYGEDSWFYRVRVQGKFPLNTTDSVFNVQCINAAMNRDSSWRTVKTSTVNIGVDVARYGDDLTCITVVIGNEQVHLETMRKSSNTEVAEKVFQLVRRYASEGSYDTIRVKVDCSNGGGVYDILDEKVCAFEHLKRKVDMCSVMYQHKSSDPRFKLKRDELIWKCSEWMSTAKLIQSKELKRDCMHIKYKCVEKNMISVSSKDEIRKLTGKSIDFLDALALAVYDLD
jgi:hypothetical protein